MAQTSTGCAVVQTSTWLAVRDPMPTSGTLTIDPGTPFAETRAFTSCGPQQLIVTPPLRFAHANNAIVSY